MPEKLSEAMVRKTLPPVRGQARYWDTEVTGFGLRVTPGGAKSFVLDYRAEGRQRRITIGSWPDWTVAAARETAKTLMEPPCPRGQGADAEVCVWPSIDRDHNSLEADPGRGPDAGIALRCRRPAVAPHPFLGAMLAVRKGL